MFGVLIDRVYRDRGLNGFENDTIRLYQIKKQKGLAINSRTRSKILSYKEWRKNTTLITIKIYFQTQ